MNSGLSRLPVWVNVALVAICVPGICSAFHSNRFGYSLDVPQGWYQLPDSVIAPNRAAYLQAAVKYPLTLDVAFEPDSTIYYLEGPYVFAAGIDAEQIPDRKFSSFLPKFLGLTNTKEFKNMMRSEPFKEFTFRNMIILNVALDKKNHRFRSLAKTNRENGPAIYADMAGCFGRRHVVFTYFYWYDGQPEPSLEERDLVLDSIQFDPAEEYDGSFLAQWGDPLAKVIAVVIVSAILGFIKRNS